MAYPRYMREKARQLRSDRDLTIDEIAERLAVGRTTAYLWVHDLPRPKRATARQGPDQRRGNQAMQAKYRHLREEAYELGRWEFPRLVVCPTFRDFVCLYIGEGYKRSRNAVSLANSDPAVIKLANTWILNFAHNPVTYSVQHHADQRFEQLAAFWSQEIGVSAQRISFQRKSNSSQLRHRSWRSKHGVLTVRSSDTYLRARLQGWIDRLQQSWLDSPHGA